MQHHSSQSLECHVFIALMVTSLGNVVCGFNALAEDTVQVVNNGNKEFNHSSFFGYTFAAKTSSTLKDNR